MKKATVNDYFRHHWAKLMVFALFTAAVSFFAPLKNFQLKWLIDSRSKQEALGYMGLVFLITFTSWFFERLSRRSFTKLACGAVEQIRGQVMENLLALPCMVVAITHDVSGAFMKQFDKVYRVEHGSVTRA